MACATGAPLRDRSSGFSYVTRRTHQAVLCRVDKSPQHPVERAQLEIVFETHRDRVAGFDDAADRVDAIGEHLPRLVLAQSYPIRGGPVHGVCGAKLIRSRKELEMVE
jgi:hypothetical protein